MESNDYFPYYAPATFVTRENRTHGRWPREISHMFEYFNFTYQTLEIHFRDGTIRTIEPSRNCPREYDGLFISRKTITDTKRGLDLFLHRVRKTSGSTLRGAEQAEVERIVNAKDKQGKNPYGYFLDDLSSSDLVFDCCLTVDQIKEMTGSVYIVAHDVCVTLHKHRDYNVHPNNTDVRSLEMIHAANRLGKSDSNVFFSLEINDVAGVYGPRFFRMGSNIFKITPQQDTSRKDGIYVTRNKPVKGPHAIVEAETLYFDFEEIELHYKLYTSYVEANDANIDDIAKKIELARLEREVSEIKLFGNLRKAKNDNEAQEISHRQRVIEMEYKQKELENKLSEQKSKNFTEMWKPISAILTALIPLLTWAVARVVKK